MTDTQTERAYATLEAVAVACEQSFGARFVAAYAMGSLSRGGFSPLVSDVDFGLVLTSPLLESDAATVGDIAQNAVAQAWALADRLSVFWGSVESLKGNEAGGRFPPFDRLDLLEHGTLLRGVECRSDIDPPSTRDIEIDGFEFALAYLGTPDRVSECLDPERIHAAGVLSLSKTVLYPPRFLYSSETGKVAGNDVAVRHYLAQHSGADADLVKMAYDWRTSGNAPAANIAVAQLRTGLVPLYGRFLKHYQERLAAHGRLDLSARATDWRHALGLDD